MRTDGYPVIIISIKFEREGEFHRDGFRITQFQIRPGATGNWRDFDPGEFRSAVAVVHVISIVSVVVRPRRDVTDVAHGDVECLLARIFSRSADVQGEINDSALRDIFIGDDPGGDDRLFAPGR